MNKTSSLAATLLRSFVPSNTTKDVTFQAKVTFRSRLGARTFARIMRGKSPLIDATDHATQVVVTTYSAAASELAMRCIDVADAPSVKASFDAKPHSHASTARPRGAA